MMIEVSISVAAVFRECLGQQSVDFKALRGGNPQGADAIYEDYVISEDLQPEFETQLKTEAALLRAELASYTVEHHLHGEHISFVFTTWQTCLDCGVLHTLAKEYLKNRMLAWWYSGRNKDLQMQHAESTVALVAEIRGVLSPKYMNRRLRWF